jgi:NTP pyrophosphatase (non-canonical NTP hydrolase)
MFLELIKLARSRYNTRPLFVRNSKIMEEVGEFSEALMFKEGFLPHKTMKEPLEGEAADVIMCIVDTLTGSYADKTNEEINDMLIAQLTLKSEKWQRVMQEQYYASSVGID